jgi:hypothetical protein
MKTIFLVLASVLFLVPGSLFAASRRASAIQSENVFKQRNEIEKLWIEAYRSYSPSESAREGRDTKKWKSSYDEESESMWDRRQNERARRNWISR